MKQFKLALISAATVLLGATAVAQPVGAINVFGGCSGNSDTRVCKGRNDSAQALVRNIINTLFFLIGSVAALMIVVGGFKYITSNGDPSAVKSAKDTIFYSVIGLVVAVMAYAIVFFVLDRLR